MKTIIYDTNWYKQQAKALDKVTKELRAFDPIKNEFDDWCDTLERIALSVFNLPKDYLTKEDNVFKPIIVSERATYEGTQFNFRNRVHIKKGKVLLIPPDEDTIKDLINFIERELSQKEKADL